MYDKYDNMSYNVIHRSAHTSKAVRDDVVTVSFVVTPMQSCGLHGRTAKERRARELNCSFSELLCSWWNTCLSMRC